jgi:hypothetical protein
VNLGFRVGYLPSRGLDAFADNDVLTQFSLDGTYPLFVRNKLVLAAGLGLDFGGRSDSIRGMSSSLSAGRLYVPLEARYAIVPGLLAFAKIAPGAAGMSATVHETTSGKDLSASAWAFSADASLGASILIQPRKRLDKRMPRFWFTPEVGYGYTTQAKLSLDTGRDGKDVLGSDESTRLRPLALSGVFWRASVGMTF